MKPSLYLTALITSLLSYAVVAVSAEWDDSDVKYYFPSAELSKDAYFWDGENKEIRMREWTPADYTSNKWDLQSGIVIVHWPKAHAYQFALFQSIYSSGRWQSRF